MRFNEFKNINENIVQPVQPVYRPKPTDNPPKQQNYVPDLTKKKPENNQEKPLVDLIAEKKKRKRKAKSRRAYGGGYWYPGFAYSSDAGEGGGDGGGGGESMYESADIGDEVEKFAHWACKKLNIKKPPKIELSYDTEQAQDGHHTGRHVVGGDSIWVYAANRNLVDILRTVFHELVHVRQGELNMIKDGDSYPGSPIEAVADMLAGKYIKIYGKHNQNIFQ